MVTSGLGLGRIEQFDSRSRNFPVSAILPSDAAPRNIRWACGIQLDQGAEPACVGFGWTQELAADPVVIANQTNADGLRRYHAAQLIDEWPGENYAGTSVLAGAKVCKNEGYIEEYRWAFSLDDLILAVSNLGPAVIGIPWYSGMFAPDAQGVIRPTGTVVGGHCLDIDENIQTAAMFGLKNSWGQWGKQGRCYMSHADTWNLLRQGGDACIPVIRRDPFAPPPPPPDDDDLTDDLVENLRQRIYTAKKNGNTGPWGHPAAFIYGQDGTRVDLTRGIEVFV